MLVMPRLILLSIFQLILTLIKLQRYPPSNTIANLGQGHFWLQLQLPRPTPKEEKT